MQPGSLGRVDPDLVLASVPRQRRLRRKGRSPGVVWQHLYSRGKFVLKESNWSKSIEETSNNKKNLAASFLTRTEAFQGGAGGLKS